MSDTTPEDYAELEKELRVFGLSQIPRSIKRRCQEGADAIADLRKQRDEARAEADAWHNRYRGAEMEFARLREMALSEEVALWKMRAEQAQEILKAVNRERKDQP